MDNELNVLSHRAGFNTALRHFKIVTEYVSEVAEGANLADLINESLEQGEIERFQAKSILNALLVEKLSYAHRSHNIEKTIEYPKNVVETISQWGNIQFILSYYHPQAGLYMINPKRKASWESIVPLMKDELIVVYAGPTFEDIEWKILCSSVADFFALLYGEKIKAKKEYLSVRREETSAASQVQVPRRRVTPRYSVQVTNELFHNGNVEAWKKIIESYNAKYPTLDVLIWYEDERINDINALFKWGKVKHGGSILFSVAGDNIKDVSKLQRYLFEGASPRFEAFLRGGIGRILDLF